MFLFLLFLHFHSCSSFFPVPLLSSPLLSSISFLPFSGRRHKMTLKGWRVVKLQHNQSITVGQGLLSLRQVRVMRNVLLFLHFPLSPLSLPFLSSTVSSIFSRSLGDYTKWPKGLACRYPNGPARSLPPPPPPKKKKKKKKKKNCADPVAHDAKIQQNAHTVDKVIKQIQRNVLYCTKEEEF